MELTAFKNMPDELIRHIMGYARPTYPYMKELNLINYEVHAGHQYTDIFYFIKSLIHAQMFRNYRIYGRYKENPPNWRILEDVLPTLQSLIKDYEFHQRELVAFYHKVNEPTVNGSFYDWLSYLYYFNKII